MGLVNITLLEQGQTGVNAAELNALVTPLQTEVNGKLDNNNIAANAAIACTKTNGSFGSVNISTSSGSITTSTGTLTVGGASTLSGTLAVTGAQTNAAGLKLTESTAPSTDANVGALYTKNDGTQTELFFREESDGDEVQVTKGGRVNVGFGAYETTDASQVGGTGATLQFGASTGAATTYRAAKDGFIFARKTNGNANTQSYNIYVNADGTTWNATTRKVYFETLIHLGNVSQGIHCPVAAGEYWKVVMYQEGGSTADLVVEFKPLS